MLAMQMKLQVFVPRNETQLLRFLSARKEDVAIIAGGTNLLPLVRTRKNSFSWLADASHLSNLRYVRRRNGKIEIGALARIRDLRNNTLTKAGYASFAQVADSFGSTAIANVATVGGNIAVAASTSDLLPALLSVDANVLLKSYQKEREMKVENFLVGQGQTRRQAGEMIAGVSFDIPGTRSISSFRKIGRRTSTFLAVVSVAIFLSYNRNKTITQIGVAFNEIKHSTPGRARNVESYLAGRVLNDRMIGEAVDRLKLDLPIALGTKAREDYWNRASRNLLREQLQICKSKMSG